LSELTHRRLTAQQGYVLLVGAGLALTWALNVFEIIAWASRAFAAYYAIQAGIAARYAIAEGYRGRAAALIVFVVIGAASAIFGAAVEV